MDGDIRFNDVSFSYDEGKGDVLSHINLHIKPGEMLALVGQSGGGKSTLCQLIPRFYEISSGSITLDGQDIRHIKLADLRGSIGIVQQDVFLFAGTILDNIRYGRPNATMDEVIEAAKLAEIHEDVMAMPDGYNTIVGERGVMLSGGQKQRVSIARIFLKNPRVLILDEATSALDTATERKIQAAFDRLAKGRTTLVIAHRLSTIRSADEIVVIGEHGILERGTHAQLVKQGGVYAELAAGARLSGKAEKRKFNGVELIFFLSNRNKRREPLASSEAVPLFMVFGRRRLSCISFSPKARGSNELYHLKGHLWCTFIVSHFFYQ